MLRIDRRITENEAARIELLSNLSLTFDRLAGVFLVLSAVTLLVALLPTLMGFWPVLAIAVLHLAIVGWCFRLAWRGYWHRQVVEIDAEQVRLIDYSARGRFEQQWAPAWLRVEIDRRGREPRVFIGVHDERTEIGAFVPAEERLEAADWLQRALESRTAWNNESIRQRASSG